VAQWIGRTLIMLLGMAFLLVQVSAPPPIPLRSQAGPTTAPAMRT
jgi:hypothetical protein